MSHHEKPEAFKNDFPNALKRNLHNWAQWRVDVNDQLVTSLMTGQRNVEVQPLGKYLHNRQHPTENPSTLLAYSASTDNISSLGMRRFLHYGIPRAKVNQGKRHSEMSSTSRAPSTYTIPEYDEDSPYLDTHDPTVRQHEEFYEPPYHPPEPEPDYGDKRLRGTNNNNSNDIDNFSDSSTDSSDTETLYMETPLAMPGRRASTNLTGKQSSKRPISRTYSTLNALDPIYMTQTQKSKSTLLNKLLRRKQREPAPKPADLTQSHAGPQALFSPPTPPLPEETPVPPTEMYSTQPPLSHMPS